MLEMNDADNDYGGGWKKEEELVVVVVVKYQSVVVFGEHDKITPEVIAVTILFTLNNC